MAKSKKVEVSKSEIVKAETTAKHSVPAMGDRSPPSNNGGGGSVIDRYRRKVKPTSKTVTDKDRPIVSLSQETQNKFVGFACTKTIFDLVENEKKLQQKEVSSEIYESFVDMLWQHKCQPMNPNIEAKLDNKIEATGQFIVSAGSKIRITMPPDAPEGEQPEDTLAKALINAGVSPANAERLVNSEVSFVPSWQLNFTDLMRGAIVEGKIHAPSATQSNAAEILFCAINGQDRHGNDLDANGRLELLRSITEDGWIALRTDIDDRTVYVPTLVDSKDFLDRVCNYANTRDELRGILTVFAPTYYCQRVVFAPSDTKASRHSRMIAEVKQIVTDEN